MAAVNYPSSSALKNPGATLHASDALPAVGKVLCNLCGKFHHGTPAGNFGQSCVLLPFEETRLRPHDR
jgi:hypothetical protein